jgi:hypothetical protein
MLGRSSCPFRSIDHPEKLPVHVPPLKLSTPRIKPRHLTQRVPIHHAHEPGLEDLMPSPRPTFTLPVPLRPLWLIHGAIFAAMDSCDGHHADPPPVN